MPRLHFLATATALAASTAAVSAAQQPGKTCTLIRVFEDGRELRSIVPDRNPAVSVSRNRGASSASASARGGSSSSVSMSSSSSSGRGRATARATASHTDEAGRTVTTTRDERGCTIVIEE